MTRTHAKIGDMAIFSYGFRVFFLLAGLSAVASVGAWYLITSHDGEVPAAAEPMIWHGHEMMFGYIVAVIAGFLLTAAPGWTGRQRVHGVPLALLALLWILGRLAYWFSAWLPLELVAVVDLAFLPALVAVLLPGWLARNAWRHIVFVGFLGLLFFSNLLIHLDSLGVTWADPGQGLRLAIATVVLLIALIGGRIVPSFTLNALRRQGAAASLRVWPWLDRSAVAATAAFVVAEIFLPGSPVAGLVALAAALLHAVRQAGWRPLSTLGEPLIWILHLGYAWLIVGLAAKGLAALTDWLPDVLALHALSVGAIATMTIAVMTRAGLGHTGRPLVAPKPVVAVYLLLTGAAVTRVFGPLVLPAAATTEISALLWVSAFALFCFVYAPILTRPRRGGGDG
jgi:uncharacterized protein involved in response to NO